MTSSATVTGWEGAGVVSMVASMCRSCGRNMPGRARRRYPVLTSNPARCSVVPCPNLRSDSGERTWQAAGDMVPLGGSPERGAARPIVTPSHHRRSRHARPRVPEERLCRPEALARERAVHLHPGGSAAVPRGGGGRRGDRGARGGGAAPARAHHDLLGALLPHEEPQRSLQDVGELLVLVRVLRDDTAFLQVHMGEHDAIAGDETA